MSPRSISPRSTSPGSPLLEIRDLHISFPGAQGKAGLPGNGRPAGARIHAVRGASVTLYPREIHAIVGESGCGKSVTVRSVLGLLPKPPARSPARLDAGTILFEGERLDRLSDHALRPIRGARISMVFQEAGKHLNPSMKIGAQIDEMLQEHEPLTAHQRAERARELMHMVELPHRTLWSYPHELSGGMKQRALIAMAISCRPRVLIADEPTTALDASVQGQVLDLLLRLRSELDMAILFVTHDFAVVQQIADRISVMYAGSIVEEAAAAELFRRPLHPYSDLLIQAVPDPTKRGTALRSIAGRIPDAADIPSGCPFHPRCPIARERCATEPPPLLEQEPQHRAACHFAGELLEHARGEQER